MAGNLIIKNAQDQEFTLEHPDNVGAIRIKSNEIATKLELEAKVALASFIGTNQNLAAAGYQKLPGGLIAQWGLTPDSNNTTVTGNFPIAFPNSAFLMVGSQRGATVQPQATAFGIISTAQYQYRSSGGLSTISTSYIAIGY